MKRLYTIEVYAFFDSQKSVNDFSMTYRRINPLAIESMSRLNDRYVEVRMTSGDVFAVTQACAEHIDRGFTACLS